MFSPWTPLPQSKTRAWNNKLKVRNSWCTSAFHGLAIMACMCSLTGSARCFLSTLPTRLLLSHLCSGAHHLSAACPQVSFSTLRWPRHPSHKVQASFLSLSYHQQIGISLRLVLRTMARAASEMNNRAGFDLLGGGEWWMVSGGSWVLGRWEKLRIV